MPGPQNLTAALASRHKYGIVTVNNPNGTFNREYKITAQELADLHATANGIPPGCTQEEWEGGLARVYGKSFDEGDVREENGSLLVKFGEVVENGRFVESFARFDPGEWSGTPPAISVPANVIAQLNSHARHLTPGRRRLISIGAGVVGTDDPETP